MALTTKKYQLTNPPVAAGTVACGEEIVVIAAVVVPCPGANTDALLGLNHICALAGSTDNDNDNGGDDDDDGRVFDLVGRRPTRPLSAV